ncbi:hypothetical protein L208DRAFT_1531995 [Tricholoma matsutake]|nr:hypothetical protein L208DRAFT_1531995 [Tricholoma matsutake 945]
MTAETSPPSISLIKLSIQYSGEKLDKLKSNYKEWCEEITIALSLNGLYEYVTGDITEPTSMEPWALANWKANSRLAYAFLASSISPSKHLFIDIKKGPDVNWTTLKDRHQKEGPVHQVQLLQQALSIQCMKDIPLPETAEKICNLIERAFSMGDIKADLLCCIALLNSLSDNFPHACSIISRDIAASTAASSYGSKDIHLFLENEQSLLKNDQRNDSRSPVALTARTKPPKSSNVPTCGNPVCKRTGHTMEYCIKPGGGMAGKTIEESKAARKLALEKKTPGLKIPITVKDVNGRTFTVMVDSEADVPTPPHSEFAGLASDPIPTATIDEVEYDGWVVIEVEATTTIDWSQHTSTPTDNAFAAEPLNQTHHTQLSLDDYPFIVDSGATMHISPDRSDFLTLCPTPPRSVRGVGGTSIAAVGIGDVKLRIA